MRLHVALALPLSLSVALLAGRSADAGYNFVRIADTSSEFAAVGFFPSINRDGTVAFRTTRISGVAGIYTGNGAIQTIAETGPDFDAFFGEQVPINAAGQVAVAASRTNPGEPDVIYRADPTRAAVPEPSTLALDAIGALGLARIRRRLSRA